MKILKRFTVMLLALSLSLLAFCLVACNNEIQPPQKPSLSAEVASEGLVYSGAELTPAVTVKNGEVVLTKDTDYTLTYANNINAGSGSVTVAFIGDYEGEDKIEKSFVISPKTLESSAIGEIGSFTYNAGAHTPAVTVKDGEKQLVKDTDYTLTYANNINAGTAKAVVTLTGNYTGTLEKQFTISRLQVEKPVGSSATYAYDGTPKTYSIEKRLEYTVLGDIRTSAGNDPVTVTLFDKVNYEWADGTTDDILFPFVITPASITNASFAVADTIEGEKPAVTLVDTPDWDITESDYEVDFGNYNDAANEVSATLRFKGNFTGTATATYKVTSLLSHADVFLDFNGAITDKAGTANAITKVGAPDLSKSIGSAELKMRTNYLTVEDASLGSDDFTLSVDVKIPYDYFENCKADYEIVSSDFGANTVMSAFQLSLLGNEMANKNALRIQIGANTQSGKFKINCLDKMKFDEWMNITCVVKRNVDTVPDNIVDANGVPAYEAEEVINLLVYIDGELVSQKSMYLPTAQVIGNGKINIGMGASWGTDILETVEVDNFYFATKALSGGSIAKMAAVNEVENGKYWTRKYGDIAFGFEDGNGESYTADIVLEAEKFDSVVFSDEIADFVSDYTEDGIRRVYKLNIPAASYADFTSGVDATLTVNGLSAVIRIISEELTGIYTDESIHILSADEKDGEYEFDIKVYGNAAKTLPVSEYYGPTFTMEGSELNATLSNDTYTVTVPSAAIATSGETKTVTVALAGAGVETTFALTLDLTEADRAAMKAATIAYMDFNGNLTEQVSGRTGKMKNDTAAAGPQFVEHTSATDKAISVKTKSSTAEIGGIGLGTEDFTLSFDFKLDPTYWTSTPTHNEYELLTSIGVNEQHYNSVKISMSKSSCLRIAVGRNDMDTYWSATAQKDAIKSDEFHKLTLVVDRKAGVDDTKFLKSATYDAYGNTGSNNTSYPKSVNYKTPEVVKVSLYIDGKYLGTKTRWSNYETYGSGAFNFGGKVSHADDWGSYIDNFIVYNRALSDYEAQTIGMYIDDYAVTPEANKLYATEIEVSDIVSGNITRTVKVTSDKTGATPVEGVTFGEGVTAVAGANAGEYTVTVPVATAEYAMTKDAASGVLKVTKVASLIKSTDEPVHVNSISNNKTTTQTQGGKVYQNIDLGTGSFTVSLYTDDFGNLPTGGSGGYILFSTHDVDDPYGITCYMSGPNFRFYLGDGYCGSRNIVYKVSGTNTNLATLTGWHNITVQVNRKNFNLSIKVYLDFNEVGSYTLPHSVSADFSLGENQQFVFGSANLESMNAHGFTRNCGHANWTPGLAGQLVAPTIVDINDVETYMESYLASLGGKTLDGDYAL